MATHEMTDVPTATVAVYDRNGPVDPEGERGRPPVAEQRTLVPDEPLQPVYRSSFPLAQLPADHDLIGPAPDRTLVESIKRLGLLEPILVERIPSGGHVVHDGRRRVKACRALGHEDAAALVIECAGAVAGTVTIAKHATRRDNLAAELEAIARFVAAGQGGREIAAATGLAPNTVRQRLRLLGLHPRLLQALCAGTISAHVATGAVRLGRTDQARLVARLDASGKLLPADLDEARRVRTTTAVATFNFAAVVATPSAAEMEVSSPGDAGTRSGPGGEWNEPATQHLMAAMAAGLRQVFGDAVQVTLSHAGLRVRLAVHGGRSFGVRLEEVPEKSPHRSPGGGDDEA